MVLLDGSSRILHYAGANVAPILRPCVSSQQGFQRNFWQIGQRANPRFFNPSGSLTGLQKGGNDQPPRLQLSSVIVRALLLCYVLRFVSSFCFPAPFYVSICHSCYGGFLSMPVFGCSCISLWYAVIASGLFALTWYIPIFSSYTGKNFYIVNVQAMFCFSFPRFWDLRLFCRPVTYLN